MKRHDQLLVGAFLMVVTCLFAGCQKSREVASAIKLVETSARMKTLLLALEEFQSAHDAYPNHLSENHSWRVEVIEYLDDSLGLPTFDRSLPWDAEENRAATESNVPALTSFRASATTTKATHFVLVVDEGTVFHKQGVLARNEIGDRDYETAIMLEFIGSEIPWTEPRDLTIEEAIELIQQSPGDHEPIIGFADGSIGSISPDSSAEKIRAIFEANDGKVATDFL